MRKLIMGTGIIVSSSYSTNEKRFGNLMNLNTLNIAILKYFMNSLAHKMNAEITQMIDLATGGNN
jgi:hypothetical protein